MDRRDFLRQMAMTAASAAVTGSVEAQRSVVPLGSSPRDGVTWNKAPCRFCGTGCHVQVGVRQGRIVAIQADPQAEVNKGHLCVKGYHVGLAPYGPDRLTRPLLRRNGELVPISWDQALDVIAERIQRNPAGFALYGSGQWTIPEGYAGTKFVKAGLGTNNIEANARLCMASAVTGFLATYGVDEPASCFDDLDRCDVMICWGNNPAEMHPVLFSRFLDRRSRGERTTLVDIGTRRTRTTGFADHYLEFKPHTDTAIALGVMALLVREGTYDRRFVENHCAFRAPQADSPTLQGEAIDFEAWKARVAEYTPERVQEISGVPAREIRRLAELFGNRDLRIASFWCMGMNQHTAGTAINSLVHGVHLLSGHWGREGDGPSSLTGQPSACGTVREVGTLVHLLPGGTLVAKPEHRAAAERRWNVPAGRISDRIGPHTVEMFRRFCLPADQGGDIDTIWVQVTNPGQTMPNATEYFDRSRELEGKFLIVSDVYPTLTTRAADLVLPSAMWVEKNGMFGNSERRTQQWFKMIEPPGEARDDCWQILAVARRLFDRGFETMRDADGKFLFHMEDERGREVPTWDFRRYYDINVDERLFEEYRGFSTTKHKNLAPYGEYVRARGLRWPVVETDDGTWRETRYRFVEGEDPFVPQGDGFQFYHSTSEDDRAQIWFHPYTPPPEVPDEEYPFWLCTGRVLEHWHSGTMTMRIPPLRRAMPQAYVELHRDDARRLGIAQGDLVRIESRRGHLDITAWIDGRGQPPRGSVFVPFFDERLRINLVTLHEYDPFSKQPDYKKCAVRIRRAPRGAST
ncbi:MAG: molybdopterin-dependent oxidoreductase [Sandaracinus sp.]|nr:molybdopterin-dependent oxidoreductase [Sandaracinus sp.]MCB9621407.1 molybdopterin-dependent oxidoreductase [Sandaracinus sp.]MCB9622886.1 molybdopterin-dependent oxidoreductase [Sandaracinus sp.]MCB9635284.1 molybdopterin-dependent oxidoreductase [Sandaracinus sp.]